MSLLDEAKKVVVTRRSERAGSKPEEFELLMAYLNGEIAAKQVTTVMNTTNLYTDGYRILRWAIKEGLLIRK